MCLRALEIKWCLSHFFLCIMALCNGMSFYILMIFGIPPLFLTCWLSCFLLFIFFKLTYAGENSIWFLSIEAKCYVLPHISSRDVCRVNYPYYFQVIFIISGSNICHPLFHCQCLEISCVGAFKGRVLHSSCKLRHSDFWTSNAFNGESGVGVQFAALNCPHSDSSLTCIERLCKLHHFS